MKWTRVGKLSKSLGDLNPNTKIWYSLEEPATGLSNISTKELKEELDRRSLVAYEIYTECCNELHKLGFSIHEFI